MTKNHIADVRPWRLKLGELYWTITIDCKGRTSVIPVLYNGGNVDLDNILMGNCFPAKEAAEKGIPEIIKLYENIRRMVEGK